MREKGNKPSLILRAIGNVLTSKLFLGALAAAAVLTAIGFGVSSQLTRESKTTRFGFEDIGELATQSAYCTEVSTIEADQKLGDFSIPFTQSKYVYSYDVVVKAGLDFSAVKVDLDEPAAAVRVTLPEVRILSAEIDYDSFQVYVEDESIFRPITLEETNAATNSLVETAKTDAVANGLLDNARENAEALLTAFLQSELTFRTTKSSFPAANRRNPPQSPTKTVGIKPNPASPLDVQPE